MNFKLVNFVITCSIILTFEKMARGTIDVNFQELQYVAARLSPYECRRLVASLHVKSYELPKNLASVERKVDEDIPCLDQLLHWNVTPDEGRGDTHETLSRRLRQLNRDDLAHWLERTVSENLVDDLRRSLNRPFGDLGDQEINIRSTTIEPLEESDVRFWQLMDAVLLAVLLGLLGTLLTLIGAVIHRAIMSRWNDKKKTSIYTDSDYSEYELDISS